MAPLNRLKLVIGAVAVTVLVAAFGAYFLMFKPKPTKWVYHGAITLNTPGIESIKDPEFVRYPNHQVYQDGEGFYYLVASVFKTDEKWLTGVLKTGDMFNYAFVGCTPEQMDGKIASYCVYNPEDEKFYLFYSDWKNTVLHDIQLARLGLAVGDIKNPSSFTDHGYLTIENMPEPLAPNLGWDPYIVKIGEVYHMLISAAKYEMHLATAKTLGTLWNYTKIAVTATIENPTLFRLNSKWYMMAGIYNGKGYDLYVSEDFKHWNIIAKNWFQDEKHPELAAGSTCITLGDTFYHLYQTPMEQNPQQFRLSLASIKVEDLIAEVTN